jgi:hypothetical protein
MKTLIFIISILGAIVSQAATQLSCDAGHSGGFAKATLIIQPVQNNQSLVQITYVNDNFPDGIAGSFVLRYSPADQQYWGIGSMGPVKGKFFITKQDNGNTELTIYGDRRIEAGFGAHLLCK